MRENDDEVNANGTNKAANCRILVRAVMVDILSYHTVDSGDRLRSLIADGQSV